MKSLNYTTSKLQNVLLEEEKLVPFAPFHYNCLRMWKKINRLTEILSKCDMGEGVWEIINWLTERIFKCEIGEGIWEIINWLIEPPSKYEMGE